MKRLKMGVVAMLFTASGCLWYPSDFDGAMEVVLTSGEVISCSGGIRAANDSVYCYHDQNRIEDDARFRSDFVTIIRRVDSNKADSNKRGEERKK